MTDTNRLVDLQAEQAVLGACFSAPVDVLPRVDTLEPGDFHDEGHGILFEAIRDAATKGIPIEPHLIIRHLGADISKIGLNGDRGIRYILGPIMDCVFVTGATTRIRHWARVVKRLSTLRNYIGAAQKIAKTAYQTDSDNLDEIYAQMSALVDAVAPKDGVDWLMTWEESIGRFFDMQLAQQQETRDIEEGRATKRATVSWEGFKRFVPCLIDGQIMAVGAEPGVGKTIIMEMLAEHWAQIGLNVVFFHLELQPKTMLYRRMSRHTGISFHRIAAGLVHPDMDKASHKWLSWPGKIDYVHCPGWSAARIASAANDRRRQGRCDAVIVDYLQMITLSYRHGQNTAQAYGDAITAMKNSGESLGIPYVIGSQYSKKSYDRKFKGPEDVRDTGTLHDKCNVFLSLDRPLATKDIKSADGTVLTRAGTRIPLTHCRVAKNTLGPEGMFDLILQGPRFTMVDVSLEKEPLNF